MQPDATLSDKPNNKQSIRATITIQVCLPRPLWESLVGK
jgi:hypothetical protein